MAMLLVTCQEGHGRILHLGHVRCLGDGCERVFKKQPAECVCGSTQFQKYCPKCFYADTKSDAQTALVDIGFGGEGHGGLEEV